MVSRVKCSTFWPNLILRLLLKASLFMNQSHLPSLTTTTGHPLTDGFRTIKHSFAVLPSITTRYASITSHTPVCKSWIIISLIADSAANRVQTLPLHFLLRCYFNFSLALLPALCLTSRFQLRGVSAWDQLQFLIAPHLLHDSKSGRKYLRSGLKVLCPDGLLEGCINFDLQFVSVNTNRMVQTVLPLTVQHEKG